MSLFTPSVLKFTRAVTIGERVISIQRKFNGGSGEEYGLHINVAEDILKRLASGNYAESETRQALAKEFAEALVRLYAAECLAFAFKDFKRKNLDAWFDKHCKAINLPFNFTDSHSYGARGYLDGQHVSIKYADERWATCNHGAFGYNTKLEKIRENPEAEVVAALAQVLRIEKSIQNAQKVIDLRDEAEKAIKAIKGKYEEDRKELAPVFVKGFSIESRY